MAAAAAGVPLAHGHLVASLLTLFHRGAWGSHRAAVKRPRGQDFPGSGVIFCCNRGGIAVAQCRVRLVKDFAGFVGCFESSEVLRKHPDEAVIFGCLISVW